jgi:hypothetical protein
LGGHDVCLGQLPIDVWRRPQYRYQLVQRLASRALVRLVTVLFLLNMGASLAASPQWVTHELAHTLEEEPRDGAPAPETATAGVPFLTDAVPPMHGEDSDIPHAALHGLAQVDAAFLTSPSAAFADPNAQPVQRHLLARWTDEPRVPPFKPPRL